MQFLKKLLRNLVILIGIGLVLLIIYPDIMSQVYQFFGLFFGPAVILILIIGALPSRGGRS